MNCKGGILTTSAFFRGGIEVSSVAHCANKSACAPICVEPYELDSAAPLTATCDEETLLWKVEGECKEKKVLKERSLSN